MAILTPSPVLERHLLLRLGNRLKEMRKARELSTTEMSKLVGISRNTLRAIENGDPSPSVGSFVRVMSVLGVAGELAMLAGDKMQPAPKGAARSSRGKPTIHVTATADQSLHAVQDLQSLALHLAAVDLLKADPAMVGKAQATLKRWLEKGSSRSTSLWLEWEQILLNRQWRRALASGQRAQALRQSSPLVTILPADTRKQVLDQIAALKKGVVLHEAPAEVAP
ncbi:helix-turn-helix transcriptional regulator [Hydrogenophaga intermedia]|uniref:helix-turn-helix transcriptional regulator n=1 Tax=Hydrogenophaga intermedia TaxID=65786 RepID=UPI0020435777|nr:helix-turn-helix transcriptional regulator [Hydrogenophaga intermedia]MCM3565389.1 helix-turn-helix domain-containing protein [Hydrogenophaga intermedia]